MSHWRDILPAVKLARGDVVEVSLDDHDLLVYRTDQGELAALTAYCPHMGNYIPNGLAPGKPMASLLAVDELRCPYHGWRFNADGQCTHVPQGQRVPAAVQSGARVARSWKIREFGGQIQLAED